MSMTPSPSSLSFLGQISSNSAYIEVFISILVLLFAYMYVIRSDAFYDFIGKLLIKLELKVTGRYDHVPVDGESIVSAQKTRASWDLIKGNVAVFAIQGRRPHMEDRFNIVTELEHTDTSIYGIFDGHGGEFAADYVEKTLFKIIMVRLLKAALSGEEPDLSVLLFEEVLNVDQQLLAVEKETGEISGTTVLIALVRGSKLYVANVGDSRAVMCDRDGNALPLSFDHKPQQVKERRRIKKAGGFISFNGVWRVAGVLATSRALGDYPLKERNLVIADPDVLTFDLDEIQPRFMVIASDGLWDAFSNDEAVSYIKDRLDEPHLGAKSIVLQAYYRGSLDNITVMVVDFTRRRMFKATSFETLSECDSISLSNATSSDDDMLVSDTATLPCLDGIDKSIEVEEEGQYVSNWTEEASVMCEKNDSVMMYEDTEVITTCVVTETKTCEAAEITSSDDGSMITTCSDDVDVMPGMDEEGVKASESSEFEIVERVSVSEVSAESEISSLPSSSSKL